MKKPLAQLRWLRLMAVLAISNSVIHAATVRKADDSTVTGEVTAIADGKLTITSNKLPTVIPLNDITQIIFKDPAAPVVAKPPKAAVQNESQDDDPNLGSALFGALFGSNRSERAEHTETINQIMPTTAPGPATQPLTELNAQFTLTNGDQFHAKLHEWADQKMQLRLAVGTTLSLPSLSIMQLWAGTPDLQAKAKALTVEAGPEDVAFVIKDDSVVVVKGLVLGIVGDSLQFRYGDQDRKIGLSKIVGLLLRSNAAAALAGFHQRVHTDSGDQLSGTLSAIDHHSIVLSSGGTPIKILLSTVTSIDFVNGQVVSLCDLRPTKVEQSAYFGRLMGYKIDKSLTGGSLVLSDGVCTRGIAVHSRCVLQYELPAGVDRFKTKLGFAQPEGISGRVIARVTGDGKTLYENVDARGDQPPINIDVPLTGIHTLALEVDFGKDQDVGDRVIWGNPRLLRGK